MKIKNRTLQLQNYVLLTFTNASYVGFSLDLRRRFIVLSNKEVVSFRFSSISHLELSHSYFTRDVSFLHNITIPSRGSINCPSKKKTSIKNSQFPMRQ